MSDSNVFLKGWNKNGFKFTQEQVVPLLEGEKAMSDHKYGSLKELEYGPFKFEQKQKDEIRKRLEKIIAYRAKVGIFGKTGAGKSSLCNALFGKDVCPVNDVEACTRDPQEVILNTGGQGIILLDLPGIGEDQERDKEYENLYQSLLPELDLVLWVLQGDDRAFARDELFYKKVVHPQIEQAQAESRLVCLFVINQADKIEPCREWNMAEHEPGANQLVNIGRKEAAVASAFQISPRDIISVSACEKYNLPTLVDYIIDALPPKKRVAVASAIDEEKISEESQKKIRQSWGDILKETVKDVTGYDVLGNGAKIIGDFVEEIVGKVLPVAVSKIGKILLDKFPFWR